MKPIFSTLCALAILLNTPIASFAYDFEHAGVQYTISSPTALTVAVAGVADKEITQIEIPQTVEYQDASWTVTEIGEQAFFGLAQLSTVTLPASITKIGTEAFASDTKLSAITLPANLTELGKGAFGGCSSLETILIPNGISSLPEYLFINCWSLQTVELNENLASIGQNAFTACGFRQIDLPESLIEIGEWAFADTKIVSIEIPAGVRNIPTGCFASCRLLSDVTLHEGLEKIGADAFGDCFSLSEIVIPQSVTSLSGFQGCSALTEFTIPSNVSSLSPEVLWDCTNLKKLVIGKGLAGLPFYQHSSALLPDYLETSYSSIGSEFFFNSSGEYINKAHLQTLKELIIDDSENPFSIKGFYRGVATPAFISSSLDYFYVGRPLVDIKEWTSSDNNGQYSIPDIDYPQGTGHITSLEISGTCVENPYFYQQVDTLILGESIERFIPENLYSNNLKKIVCRSITPPGVNMDNAFPANVYAEAVLCVPDGCRNSYATATCWKNFINIEEIGQSGNMEYPCAEGDSGTVNVFNLQGCLIRGNVGISEINDLPSGVYIIVSEKGSRKIII